MPIPKYITDALTSTCPKCGAVGGSSVATVTIGGEGQIPRHKLSYYADYVDGTKACHEVYCSFCGALICELPPLDKNSEESHRFWQEHKDVLAHYQEGGEDTYHK